MNSDYNKTLRAKVLIASIREEEVASDVIKNLLRIVKPDSKTLDNKSSSLSFKNKIDLLYDLDDIDKDNYTALIKFMEIRNQFIHNPNCNSFKDLILQAPETTKYLETAHKNDIQDKEESLEESFKNLFFKTMGQLLVLKLEYRKGATIEMNKYVDSVAVRNFKSIYDKAFNHWNSIRLEKYKTSVIHIFGANSENEIKDFENYLNYYLLDEKITVLDKIINEEVNEKDIFQRRVSLIEDLKKEQSLIAKNGS